MTAQNDVSDIFMAAASGFFAKKCFFNSARNSEIKELTAINDPRQIWVSGHIDLIAMLVCAELCTWDQGVEKSVKLFDFSVVHGSQGSHVPSGIKTDDELIFLGSAE